MTINLTIDDVRDIIRRHLRDSGFPISEDAAVRFVHRYSDGSGESEVEDICAISIIEVSSG